jgi:Sec-independent protein secretion pathway component TatC
MRTITALLFGETWQLPVGLAVAIGVALVAREVLGDAWEHVGGFVLLAGVVLALVVSVAASARGRR